MTCPDFTFNLTALADHLFEERRLLPLADKIRRARDLHSLSADLAMALESLDALLKAPTATSDFEKKHHGAGVVEQRARPLCACYED